VVERHESLRTIVTESEGQAHWECTSDKSASSVPISRPDLPRHCKSRGAVQCNRRQAAPREMPATSRAQSALALETEKTFYATLRSVKLHNLYGPTEAAVDVSCRSVDEFAILDPKSNVLLWAFSETVPAATGPHWRRSEKIISIRR